MGLSWGKEGMKESIAQWLAYSMCSMNVHCYCFYQLGPEKGPLRRTGGDGWGKPRS